MKHIHEYHLLIQSPGVSCILSCPKYDIISIRDMYLAAYKKMEIYILASKCRDSPDLLKIYLILGSYGTLD